MLHSFVIPVFNEQESLLALDQRLKTSVGSALEKRGHQAAITAGLEFGVLGEYVGRIFEESKRRPLYLVDQVLSAQSASVSETPPPTTFPPAS